MKSIAAWVKPAILSLLKSCCGWGTGTEDAGIQPDHQADAPRRSESKNGKILNQGEKIYHLHLAFPSFWADVNWNFFK